MSHPLVYVLSEMDCILSKLLSNPSRSGSSIISREHDRRIDLTRSVVITLYVLTILTLTHQPEWYFTHVLNVSHEHRSFMETVIQPLISQTEFRNIIAWREFTLLLLPLLSRKLRKTVPALIAHPSVLAHTIYQALTFDSSLREEGFELGGTSAALDKEKCAEPLKWQGISEIILGRKEWFEAWMEGERICKYIHYCDRAMY